MIPRLRVLNNCALVIDQGKIVEIGDQKNIAVKYTSKSIFQLDGHALIPGLINAHCHSAMSLFRGIADDQPLQTWLEHHIWPAEQKWVSEEFVRDGTELALAEMIASGTTCFSDMYFYPEETAEVALKTGIRAQITSPVLDFPSSWATDADEYLQKAIALHDRYRTHPLISVGFGPHAPYTVSDEPLRKIAMYAEELQAPIQIHLHETAGEISVSEHQHAMRPIERLNELGILSPLSQCVHMTQIIDADISLLQATGAHVVHCPESNLKLASGLCPVDKLLKNGINVCLGTDGAASNNDLDLLDEMRTAALIGKLAADNASAVDAMTALELATINGAKALGLADLIGSLEAGKEADIVAIDLSGLQHQPMYDPIGQLVYTQAGHKVSHVWVQGNLLLHDYALTTLDIKHIKSKAGQWQKKLAGHASQA